MTSTDKTRKQKLMNTIELTEEEKDYCLNCDCILTEHEGDICMWCEDTDKENDN